MEDNLKYITNKLDEIIEEYKIYNKKLINKLDVMDKKLDKLLHRNKKQINKPTGLIPDDYDNRDWYIDEFGDKHIPCNK